MKKSVRIIETALDTGNKLTEVGSLEWRTMGSYGNHVIIDQNQTCQEILGFGGAFTEAAAVTLSKVSKALRDEVLDAYYTEEKGIGYNIGRVHINSCDFALNNYDYVEENDAELKSFDIGHDQELIIPLIKDAMKRCPIEMDILASPWSPPGWMKTNDEMNHGGSLLPEYFGTWALYYTKFIKAYEKEGVPIWGISVQNEPAAVQTWDSCIYSAEEERDFVKNHLGPVMEAEGLGHKKIIIWDHNRDIMVERASTVLQDQEAAKYVWGTGFHWYVSEAFENVGKVHDLFPDKHLLFTEGCQEGGCKVGDWSTGERYGRNMIQDLNNWCEGYLDWNIVLDETGGPNHVNNLCDAPIIVDTKEQVIHYNSSYYYIGHLSKFIKKGAKRIVSNLSMDQVYLAAFVNPDQELVMVCMNESNEAKAISLEVDEFYLDVDLKPHSIVTLLG